MLRSPLRTFRPPSRVTGTTTLQQVTPIWEGIIVRRTFASRTSQTTTIIAPRRPSMPSTLTPRTKTTNTLRTSTRRSFGTSAKARDRKSAPKKSSSSGAAAAQEPLSVSARLKKLSREYGWTALGVYLALSVLDFPFCFMLVRVVGTEKIGQIEHFIVSNLKKLVPQGVQDWYRDYKENVKESERNRLGNNEISEDVEAAGWGVEEAEARNKAEASLGTQLALAYAIHKSFIFIRVPLTAAVLPKVVKVLRSWGWNIGKRRGAR